MSRFQRKATDDFRQRVAAELARDERERLAKEKAERIEETRARRELLRRYDVVSKRLLAKLDEAKWPEGCEISIKKSRWSRSQTLPAISFDYEQGVRASSQLYGFDPMGPDYVIEFHGIVGWFAIDGKIYSSGIRGDYSPHNFQTHLDVTAAHVLTLESIVEALEIEMRSI